MSVLCRIPSVSLTLLLLSAPCLFAQRLSESTGVNLFKNNCTSCHGITPVEHAPTEATIKQMPPERIYEAITTGSMKTNAAALTDADKRLLAEYMGGRKLDKEDAGDMKNMPNACATHPPVKDMNAPSWNGWGDLSNTRFQPAKAAGLTAGKVSRLKLKWAFGFPGATALYGQTVVDGRVFVSTQCRLRLLARRRYRLHPLVVPFAGGGAQRHHHRAAEGRAQPGSRRSSATSAATLRARCLDRRTALESLDRRSSAGARHRQSQAVPGPAVRPAGFARRGRVAQSGPHLLHLPRRDRGARFGDRASRSGRRTPFRRSRRSSRRIPPAWTTWDRPAPASGPRRSSTPNAARSISAPATLLRAGDDLRFDHGHEHGYRQDSLVAAGHGE